MRKIEFKYVLIKRGLEITAVFKLFGGETTKKYFVTLSPCGINKLVEIHPDKLIVVQVGDISGVINSILSPVVVEDEAFSYEKVLRQANGEISTYEELLLSMAQFHMGQIVGQRMGDANMRNELYKTLNKK